MTTITAVRRRTESRPDTEAPAARLRAVLALNAGTSSAAGLVAALAPRWVADTAGLGSVGWIRAVGVALVVFAADVALVARYSRSSLRAAALTISVVDIAWVVATVGVVAAADLHGAGLVVAGVMAVGVAGFATLQLWFRRRLG